MRSHNIFLGINVSHGASASLMVNGKIVKAFQEERFNKIKNFVGYPKLSIDECLKYVKKHKKIINCAAFSTYNNVPVTYKYPLEHLLSIEDWFNYYGKDYYGKKKDRDSYFETLNKKLKKKKYKFILRL